MELRLSMVIDQRDQAHHHSAATLAALFNDLLANQRSETLGAIRKTALRGQAIQACRRVRRERYTKANYREFFCSARHVLRLAAFVTPNIFDSTRTRQKADETFSPAS
jgi:hypothetical protein